MAKLLFVDDDDELRSLCIAWFDQKYVVETVGNGKDALLLAEGSYFDLIILDLGLPDCDGTELLKKLRTAGGATPVLVLTGRSDVNSKVELLDLGADDYLTKPFHFKELEARVHSLLRRPREAFVSNTLKAGPITLNLTNARVRRNGEEIILTPTEFALLEFFMRHPNQTFSQESLMQRVWSNDSAASPDIVRVYITRLRKKLEIEGEPPIIENQRGHGYILGQDLGQ